MHLSPLLTLALIPLFAIADRRVGKGGNGARSTSMGGVLVVCGVLGFLTGLWAVALPGLLWCGYRSLGFHGIGGSSTPRTVGEIVSTLIRHALPGFVMLWIGASHLLGLSGLELPMALGAYAVGATGLGLIYARIVDNHVAHLEPGGDENAIIEIVRGAAFGAAIAAWAITAS